MSMDISQKIQEISQICDDLTRLRFSLMDEAVNKLKSQAAQGSSYSSEAPDKPQQQTMSNEGRMTEQQVDHQLSEAKNRIDKMASQF